MHAERLTFANESETLGELIYTCKIRFLAGSNLQVRIKPDIFSRFSQPEHFLNLLKCIVLTVLVGVVSRQ